MRGGVKIADLNLIINNDKYIKYPIIIYGTGLIAERVIEQITDILRIKCILDGNDISGKFKGIQISDWDYIDDSEEIILIIAAAEKNIPVIYKRIYDISTQKKIKKIINAYGVPVDRKYAEIQYTMLNQRLMIDTWESLGEIISSHEVVDYIYGLISFIKKNKYDGQVLFAARDGFIFYEVYMALRNTLDYHWLPEAHYLYISRQGAINMSTNGEKLRYIFDKVYVDDKEIANIGDEISKLNTVQNRKNYLKYLEQNGISVKNKVLLCEYFAKGTTQYLLTDIFENIEGYYYMYSIQNKVYPIKVNYKHRITEFERLDKYYNMVEYEEIFERMFSSTDGKFLYMDDGGQPVFEIDNRDAYTKDAIKRIQSGIKQKVISVFEANEVNEYINNIEDQITLLRGGCEFSKEMDMSIFDL